MPNIKSAIKRVSIIEKKTLQNNMIKSAYKTAIKKFEEAAQAGNVADASCAPIQELLDALDSYIPEPERDTDKPFLMPVEDVFTITGRGTVATGRIERGIVRINDVVEIVGMGAKKQTVVTGVEMFRKTVDEGIAGFAEVYVLKKEEGGRHTPFFNGYRPQFYFRTTDVTGTIELPAGVEMVMPGDNIKMTIELSKEIAIEQGLRFAIREGGRTVGSGVVSQVIE